MMNDNRFANVLWCDLGVVLLEILYCAPWDNSMLCVTPDKPRETKPIVKIYLCDCENKVFSRLTSYREKMMAQGFYIGHHFGPSVYIKAINETTFAICSENPGRIIWSYLIKYILTIYAVKNNMLHLKGGCFSYNGKVFLVLGRGGGGKTEFIRALCKNGAEFRGNTHLLVSNNKVFAVASKIRVRNDKEETYLDPSQFQTKWCEISGILWINYRTDNITRIAQLTKDELFNNMQYYSEAIGNWELKEDVSDYLESNPIMFSNWIEKIHEMMRRLCDKYIAFYLNLDINRKESMDKVLELLENIGGENYCDIFDEKHA